MNKINILIFILICILIIKLYNYNSYNFKNEYSHLSIKNIIKTNNIILNNKNIINRNRINNDTIFFLSFDYEIMPLYYNNMLTILTKYCEQHNNKLIIFDHSKDKNKISPYWYRVYDFIKLSNQYSKNTIIIYLDIDTCINSKYFNLSVSDIINSIDYIENSISDIYIGNDSSKTEFGNAGIIIIRNTDWSKQFLNLWWSKYNNKNWNLENDKWVCKIKQKKCNWARDGYEQGEFNNIYRKNEINAQDHIKILHYSLLSNNSLNLDAFIWHFYYIDDYTRDNYYNKIYNDYKKINILI